MIRNKSHMTDAIFPQIESLLSACKKKVFSYDVVLMQNSTMLGAFSLAVNR